LIETDIRDFITESDCDIETSDWSFLSTSAQISMTLLNSGRKK